MTIVANQIRQHFSSILVYYSFCSMFRRIVSDHFRYLFVCDCVCMDVWVYFLFEFYSFCWHFFFEVDLILAGTSIARLHLKYVCVKNSIHQILPGFLFLASREWKLTIICMWPYSQSCACGKFSLFIDGISRQIHNDTTDAYFLFAF